MLIVSPKVLALFIANRRKLLNLSQAEVCEQVGLKQQTISAFENDPAGTRVETLFRILSAVNLDLNLSPKESSESFSDSSKVEEWYA